MESLFETHSVYAGVSINPKTGEILDILEPGIINKGIIRPGSYKPPIYKQLAIDTARETTSQLCESVLQSITGGKKVKRGNNKGFDILLPNGKKLEAKVGRIGNSAVIKENQLFEFDADFWGFVFYRTLLNYPPSYFTSLENKLSPRENLLRNIFIKKVFIFPTKVMKYYWNTVPVKKGVISTTGIAHRPLSIFRANELLGNDVIPGTGFKKDMNYGKHNFPVHSIDFEI